MFRLATSIFALTAAVSVPAFAADWGSSPEDIYREGYSIEPYEWTELGDQDDGIHIETGLRYWYSMGERTVSTGGSEASSTDTSHIGEVFLRVNEDATATWAEAKFGYSAVINGENDDATGGEVAYGGADFGWNAIDDGKGSGLGGFVGYLYWNDSPDTGRNNYTTATSDADITWDPTTGQTFLPGASVENHIDVHALRLGVSGNAKLGDMFDIRAEVAAVPYASVTGVIGADDPEFNTDVYAGPAQIPYSDENGNISEMRSSETSIDGWGYGAMAEAWIGVHPMENLTFRLGGRAWYLQGTADSTYSIAQIGNPSDSGGDPDYDTGPTFVNTTILETDNPFSLLRYGLLAELTYSF